MIIGITGGIGSGKTSVLNYLKTKYHAYIISSDAVAKDLMKFGGKLYKQIKINFPDVISNHTIHREKLARIVFGQPERLRLLNTLTHPAVIQTIQQKINNSDASLIILESAILLGTELEKQCDAIWFVYCDKNKRIGRLKRERGYLEKKTEDVMENQPSDEEYRRVADEVIDNSYDFEHTKEQIDVILSSRMCGF